MQQVTYLIFLFINIYYIIKFKSSVFVLKECYKFFQKTKNLLYKTNSLFYLIKIAIKNYLNYHRFEFHQSHYHSHVDPEAH